METMQLTPESDRQRQKEYAIWLTETPLSRKLYGDLPNLRWTAPFMSTNCVTYKRTRKIKKNYTVIQNGHIKAYFLLSTIVFMTLFTGVLGHCPPNCETCAINGSCYSCITGKVGTMCENNCSIGCENGCVRYTGLCTISCENGTYQAGSSCTECPGKCDICTAASDCEQCKPGYYGPVCKYSCSHCIRNECTIQKCTLGCEAGFYPETMRKYVSNEPDYITCKSCPDQCPKCTSWENCSSCIDRRWGTTCQNTCNGDCKKCDQQTGECLPTTCTIGEYMTSEGKCSPCPDNCKSCNASGCNACHVAFYGTFCAQLNCSSISHCQRCDYNSSGFKAAILTCHMCEAGYYGAKCNKTCSIGCTDGCDTVDGNCTCSREYSGERCDTLDTPLDVHDDVAYTNPNGTNKLAGNDTASTSASKAYTKSYWLEVGIPVGFAVLLFGVVGVACMYYFGCRRAKYKMVTIGKKDDERNLNDTNTSLV